MGMAEWKDDKIHQCDHKVHRERSETRWSSRVRNKDQSHKNAVMERGDFKIGVHHGNQSSGLLSQWTPLHLANMEPLLFTDCWRVYQQRAGGGGGGWGGFRGCSASKAIALLPMILSGLGSLNPHRSDEERWTGVPRQIWPVVAGRAAPVRTPAAVRPRR